MACQKKNTVAALALVAISVVVYFVEALHQWAWIVGFSLIASGLTAAVCEWIGMRKYRNEERNKWNP